MRNLLAKNLSSIAIIYFLFGLAFAIFYAYFYHWGGLAYFSPGFYVVLLTWPYQLPGLIIDFTQYGWAGKILY